MRTTLASLTRDRRGNVTILAATGMTMLLGATTLAVDTGSIYLEKRRLQGIADVSALATARAAQPSETAARSVLAANHADDAQVTNVEPGTYTPDPALDPAARFVAGGSGGNAVRVTLKRQVPLFFGRLLTGQAGTEVVASAMAARMDLASFAIGSRLAAVGGGLPGALLSGLAGTNLQLSAMDYQALLGADVDLLAFADALRTTARLQTLTFADTLDAQVTLPQAVSALAMVAPDAQTRSALQSLAAQVPGTSVQLSDLVDLGGLGNGTAPDPAQPLDINSYDFVREMLLLASGKRQVALDLATGVPGVAAVKLTLAIGERPAQSPWIAVARDGSVVVRTAQTRLYFDVALAQALSGLLSVHVPLYLELAQAEASLASIRCSGASTPATVSLDVRPALGQVSIAAIDTRKLGDFKTPLALGRATLVHTLLADVTGKANIALGGVTTQRVSFTSDDIDAGRIKTVSTGDLVGGVAASLVRNIDLQVDVLGLGVNVSALTATVGGILSVAAPALDSVVDQTTGLLGVHVGQADVRVLGVRCGRAMLVG